uniref:Uncharacterized protein n=1 Tax=Anguilla anguilla TaxID=7936 RepID=A0A0E9RMP0_ANGAN
MEMTPVSLVTTVIEKDELVPELTKPTNSTPALCDDYLPLCQRADTTQ